MDENEVSANAHQRFSVVSICAAVDLVSGPTASFEKEYKLKFEWNQTLQEGTCLLAEDSRVSLR
jgi:hypothetical protein